MKLLWCCVVAALVSAASAAVDVEKTVAQVQNILQANEGLPRLTRDEIIQLLNDIRAEDAKSKSSSTEDSRETKTTTSAPKPYRIEDNEISPITQLPYIKEKIKSDDKEILSKPVTRTTQKPPSTTKSSGSSVVVVLPYTPRDGSSLQELYTRPPRVKVVPASEITTTPSSLLSTLEKLHKSLDNKKSEKSLDQPKDDFPAELQAFLSAHGLKGKPGQDNFLLPLEGFKPLPPAKIVDGTVQLPENILLTYDLISSDSDHKSIVHDQKPPANFLFEPLRPEFPFELETSQSETKKTVLPLDLPVKKTKSDSSKPNYEPIDYDAIKVIPLKQGLSPIDDVRAALENEQNKRQTESNVTSTESPKAETSSETSTSDKSDDTPTGDSAAADTGASIADLEDSFGGAAPEEPGDSELPPPRKNGFYWMLDWNSFLEVGDGDTKVNIRFEPKLGDPQMFVPVNVP